MYNLFTFHWYGFIVGIAIVATVLVGEFVLLRWVDDVAFLKNKQHSRFKKKVQGRYWLHAGVALFGGLIGARAWHVGTDLELYVDDFTSVLRIQDGGLSIIGAVLGIVLSLLAFWSIQKYVFRHSFIPDEKLVNSPKLFWFDLIALSLPIGQIIGRLGNWVNQELYGYPTSLPWGIYINEPARLPGFEAVARYHPLFAYEMLLLAPLVGLLWWFWQKKWQQLGSGFFILLYLAWYGLVRFVLEFLRIDKSMVEIMVTSSWGDAFSLNIGINQAISVVTAAIALIILLTSCVFQRFKIGKKYRENCLQILGLFVVVGLIVSGMLFNIQISKAVQAGNISQFNHSDIDMISRYDLSNLADGTKIPIEIANTPLEVEVVTSPQALALGLGERTKIGSDGMLFILPKATKTSFWMYRMRFDLDLIWIRKGVITGITKNVPAPSQNASTLLPNYVSPGVVDMVLEVPAGTAASYGWTKGDSILLDLTRDTLGIK